MEYKNYPKRTPTTVMGRKSMEQIHLGILEKKLEAKVKDHGIRVFTCEILEGGVVKMGYTVPDEAVLHPQEARQSLKAKEKLGREIKFSKRNLNPIHKPHQPPHKTQPSHQPTYHPNVPQGVWIHNISPIRLFEKLSSIALGKNKHTKTVFLNTTFLISFLALCNTVYFQVN